MKLARLHLHVSCHSFGRRRLDSTELAIPVFPARDHLKATSDSALIWIEYRHGEPTVFFSTRFGLNWHCQKVPVTIEQWRSTGYHQESVAFMGCLGFKDYNLLERCSMDLLPNMKLFIQDAFWHEGFVDDQGGVGCSTPPPNSIVTVQWTNEAVSVNIHKDGKRKSYLIKAKPKKATLQLYEVHNRRTRRKPLMKNVSSLEQVILKLTGGWSKKRCLGLGRKAECMAGQKETTINNVLQKLRRSAHRSVNLSGVHEVVDSITGALVTARLISAPEWLCCGVLKMLVGILTDINKSALPNLFNQIAIAVRYLVQRGGENGVHMFVEAIKAGLGVAGVGNNDCLGVHALFGVMIQENAEVRKAAAACGLAKHLVGCLPKQTSVELTSVASQHNEEQGVVGFGVAGEFSGNPNNSSRDVTEDLPGNGHYREHLHPASYQVSRICQVPQHNWAESSTHQEITEGQILTNLLNLYSLCMPTVPTNLTFNPVRTLLKYAMKKCGDATESNTANQLYRLALANLHECGGGCSELYVDTLEGVKLHFPKGEGSGRDPVIDHICHEMEDLVSQASLNDDVQNAVAMRLKLLSDYVSTSPSPMIAQETAENFTPILANLLPLLNSGLTARNGDWPITLLHFFYHMLTLCTALMTRLPRSSPTSTHVLHSLSKGGVFIGLVGLFMDHLLETIGLRDFLPDGKVGGMMEKGFAFLCGVLNLCHCGNGNREGDSMGHNAYVILDVLSQLTSFVRGNNALVMRVVENGSVPGEVLESGIRFIAGVFRIRDNMYVSDSAVLARYFAFAFKQVVALSKKEGGDLQAHLWFDVLGSILSHKTHQVQDLVHSMHMVDWILNGKCAWEDCGGEGSCEEAGEKLVDQGQPSCSIEKGEAAKVPEITPVSGEAVSGEIDSYERYVSANENTLSVSHTSSTRSFKSFDNEVTPSNLFHTASSQQQAEQDAQGEFLDMKPRKRARIEENLEANLPSRQQVEDTLEFGLLGLGGRPLERSGTASVSASSDSMALSGIELTEPLVGKRRVVDVPKLDLASIEMARSYFLGRWEGPRSLGSTLFSTMSGDVNHIEILWNSSSLMSTNLSSPSRQKTQRAHSPETGVALAYPPTPFLAVAGPALHTLSSRQSDEDDGEALIGTEVPGSGDVIPHPTNLWMSGSFSCAADPPILNTSWDGMHTNDTVNECEVPLCPISAGGDVAPNTLDPIPELVAIMAGTDTRGSPTFRLGLETPTVSSNLSSCIQQDAGVVLSASILSKSLSLVQSDRHDDPDAHVSGGDGDVGLTGGKVGRDGDRNEILKSSEISEIRERSERSETEVRIWERSIGRTNKGSQSRRGSSEIGCLKSGCMELEAVKLVVRLVVFEYSMMQKEGNEPCLATALYRQFSRMDKDAIFKLKDWAVTEGDDHIRILRLLAYPLFDEFNYKSRERIGRGQYTHIHRCYQPITGGPETCAVKVFDLPFAEDSTKTVRDIYLEISILEQLSSQPNVVEIFDYGVTEDSIFLVTREYPCDLLKWRRQFPPSSPSMARLFFKLFLQVVRAVQAVHDAGVVHFDVKCSNVFMENVIAKEECLTEDFDDNGIDLLLGDFGEAAVLDSKWVAKLATSRGTECMKSPEMLLFGTKSSKSMQRPGPPSDVWSLGCLLYELITGVALFDASDYGHFHVQLTDSSIPLVDESKSSLIPKEIRATVLTILDFVLIRDASLRPPLSSISAWVEGVLSNGVLPCANDASMCRISPVPHGLRRFRGSGLRKAHRRFKGLRTACIPLHKNVCLIDWSGWQDPWMFMRHGIGCVVVLTLGTIGPELCRFIADLYNSGVLLMEIEILSDMGDVLEWARRCANFIMGNAVSRKVGLVVNRNVWGYVEVLVRQLVGSVGGGQRTGLCLQTSLLL